MKHRAPLFASRCKVRRVYFRADMSAKQKADLEATNNVRIFTVSFNQLNPNVP